MSDIEEKFQAAVEKVRAAPGEGTFKPSNELKLRMYGLFRQATDGDVTGKRPGMLDVINRMKYDAWAKLRGTSKADAMKQYVDEVEKIDRQYG